MKPVGLTNAHAPTDKPHAVVQLRRDNALGTLYNIVGFQTKMKYGAQDVFRMIPGLERRASRVWGASTATPSSIRPACWMPDAAAAQPNIRFAGQITGVEGYVESAAMGLLAGRLAAAEMLGRRAAAGADTGRPWARFSPTSPAARGQDLPADEREFRPVSAARPGLKGGRKGRRDRYRAYTDRAKAAWRAWLCATACSGASPSGRRAL